MKYINVAIDGPAGAGKSSIARAVASGLGYIYVDTGALYRAIAYYAISRQADLKVSSQIISLLGEIDIALRHENGEQRVFVNSQDVSDLIRSPEVSMGASAVSAVPEVRSFLLDLQRKIAAGNNVIMDGRDIGTVVLPDAQLKIYLTASVEERAARRYAQIKDVQTGIKIEDICADIIKRDNADMNRETAPLRQAEDAVLIDSTDMTIDQVIEKICELISLVETSEG